jgi:hypothetical protein
MKLTEEQEEIIGNRIAEILGSKKYFSEWGTKIGWKTEVGWKTGRGLYRTLKRMIEEAESGEKFNW